MQPSPLTLVRERFKDKASLVKAIEKLADDKLWLDRVNADKGLARVSNRKLLHLHEVLSQVKERFGTREKLIAAVVEVQGRVQDADYRNRFERLPTPRLFELLRAAERRAAKAKKSA